MLNLDLTTYADLLAPNVAHDSHPQRNVYPFPGPYPSFKLLNQRPR